MNSLSIMLSEKSQKVKDKYLLYVVTYVSNLKKIIS